ncbi:hypothetical protein TeGR_g6950, partial [Tetraparma gracilis]
LLLLSFPYRSTDFDVHRNWLALTRHLPAKRWYLDETDEDNTLDYPPSFAFAEALLSNGLLPLFPAAESCSALVSTAVGARIATPACVLFQRGSVVLSASLLYFPACLLSLRLLRAPSSFLLPLTSSFGLLLLDHVHFQYNAPLLSLLLLSASLLSPPSPPPRSRALLAAFLYALLLTLKHLYLVLAPLYFLHLLSSLCLPLPRRLPDLLLLSAVTLAALVPPFVPFRSCLPELLGRLFPFERGLTHAYWAPNVWALYTFLDRALLKLSRFLPLPTRGTAGGGTSGLISASGLAVVPDVSGGACALLILLFLSFPLAAIWGPRGRRPRAFLLAAPACAMTCFMLGYHVHEKAAMTHVLLLALLAAAEPTRRHCGAWLRASAVGHLGLMPLVPPGIVYTPVKYALFLAHLLLCLHVSETAVRGPVLSRRDLLVALLLLLPVFLFAEVLHPLLLGGREGAEFLPLMAVSVTLGGLNLAVWAELHLVVYEGLWLGGEGGKQRAKGT